MTHKIKIEIFVLIFLVLTLLILPTVLSLGISPGRVIYDYEENAQKEVTLKLINDEGRDIEVLLYTEGELAEHINLEKKKIKIKALEREVTFKYKIKIPHLSEPGTHIANIVAREIPSEEDQTVGVIASVAVASQLYIQVPYPGKYIEPKLDIQDSDGNTKVKFYVSAISKGEQRIARAQVHLDILTKTYEKIHTMITDYVLIEPQERYNFVLEWQPTVPPGEYIAKATIIYDEQTVEIEKTFKIGSQLMEILSVLINDFVLGEIAKFNILVENKWSQAFENVYSQIILKDQADKTIADTKSASDTVEGLAKKDLVAFWDSAGVDPGTYSGLIRLHYAGKQAEHEIEANIQNNKMTVSLPGITAQVVSSGKKGSGTTTLLIIGIVLLILVNLMWFFYFKKKFAQSRQNKKMLKDVKSEIHTEFD
ncbi:MAG: hypothetical protein ABH817_00390 [archaeon]